MAMVVLQQYSILVTPQNPGAGSILAYMKRDVKNIVRLFYNVYPHGAVHFVAGVIGIGHRSGESLSFQCEEMVEKRRRLFGGDGRQQQEQKKVKERYSGLFHRFNFPAGTSIPGENEEHDAPDEENDSDAGTACRSTSRNFNSLK